MGPEKARAPSKSTVASSTLESDETLVFPMSMQRTHNPQDLLSQTTELARVLHTCQTALPPLQRRIFGIL
eukprot:symbB.v1.2.019524.t1/scaffold1597.1/size110265/7